MLPLLMLAPLGVRAAMIDDSTKWLAALVLMLQAAALVWVGWGLAWPGPTEMRRRKVRLGACAMAIGAVALLWWFEPKGLLMAAALPHAITYSALLLVFVRSMMPGQTPLITIAATRIRGPLPDVLLRYTRNVTSAWCVFCAMQLVLSAMLGGLAMLHLLSFEVWRQFVTVWSLPLVAVMFLAEYGVRRWLHSDQNPTGLIETFRGMRRAGHGRGH